MSSLATDETADLDAEPTVRTHLSLPFYLYEGADFDDGSWFAPCARGLRGEAYADDQYSGELYFLQQLRGHRWRVREPSKALLFVVPLYINAALQPSMSGTSCNGTHFQKLLDATAAAVAATEQYARHQGADHVIVCNSWKLAQQPPHQAPWSKQGQLPNDAFRHTFRNSIVGHMETRHGEDAGFWRCSVVSPYVANYEAAAAAHLRTPSAPERDVSFYFQGGANNRGTYGYAFRQAALAQLEGLPRAHVSAFSLPGAPAACRGSLTTNCRAGRSNPAFRSLMARARFNLVLRGDSPSSRRIYDGLAAGALSVLVSDQLWSVGLPFACLVPWRRMGFVLAERPFETPQGAAATLAALDALSPQLLGRMQRVANRHRRDVLWNVNGSRVAENVLITAALRCLPANVAKRAAARAPTVAHALRQLRQQCPYGDASIACRKPDASNCAGCETGDLAGGSLLEHCCADSCPACNRSAARCVPPVVYYGDPLAHGPARRDALEAYLSQKDKSLPPALKQWKLKAGRPSTLKAKPSATRAAAKQSDRPGGAARPHARPHARSGASTGSAARAGREAV